MGFYSIILAAGAGTRMKSTKAKPLHKVCGKPMLDWVVSAVQSAGSEGGIVVIGYEGEQIREHLRGEGAEKLQFAVQEKQLGTGHAVMQCMELLKNETGTVLVICGDTPLVTEDTLIDAFNSHTKLNNAVTVLTTDAPNPEGYGRVITDDNEFVKIVEHKDTTDTERKISLINSGIYFFDIQKLSLALEKLTCSNAQGEYYLTDTLAILRGMGEAVGMHDVPFEETMGINDRIQLAQANDILRKRILNRHMLNGVTIIDPVSTHIEDGVSIGIDTVIYPNTYIHNDTVIGENCSVGPFAYIRPHSRIGNGVKVGDFVEIKNSSVGNGTKISHLTYVGDADVGERVNFGCGTVIVNYDGLKKHRTVIEDDAFIGCNTNLVSPVRVKHGAYTAAGSTITDEVPEGALAIARSRQVIKEQWTKKNGREKKK